MNGKDRQMSKVKCRKSKCAYTLIEVLIVMSIIAVIMGFLLNATTKARQKAKLTQVHALMNSIAGAMTLYQDDFGALPPDDTINRYVNSVASLSSGECLYYYLGTTFKKGVNASIFAGPYMKYKGTEVVLSRVTACDFDGDGNIDDDLNAMIDPWGKALHYRIPPTKNLNTYDLYSEGPNQADNNGDGDDVNNWE